MLSSQQKDTVIRNQNLNETFGISCVCVCLCVCMCVCVCVCVCERETLRVSQNLFTCLSHAKRNGHKCIYNFVTSFIKELIIRAGHPCKFHAVFSSYRKVFTSKVYVESFKKVLIKCKKTHNRIAF